MRVRQERRGTAEPGELLPCASQTRTVGGSDLLSGTRGARMGSSIKGLLDPLLGPTLASEGNKLPGLGVHEKATDPIGCAVLRQ